MTLPSFVPGGSTGISFPTGIAALIEGGPAFLTRAFHATGALGHDNAVVEIVATSEFVGGGMGRKLSFDVRYAKAVEGLTGALFAKFPRDFGDPLRDMFATVMEPEVRLALLSRRDDFPIPVPTCYFADYDPATSSGLLITERIPYGVGACEPLHDKCLDYEIAEPINHYRAMTTTLATLSAAHKSAPIGAEIDRQFPFNADAIDPASRIPFDRVQLEEKLENLKRFAAIAPGLFPNGLGEAAFIARFAEDAMLVFDAEDAIHHHLNHQSDLVTLCHWNMNIDNAWFWRDERDALRVGLLDWGGVAPLNIARAFYGMICAAETDFLDRHEDGLIDLLLHDYAALGGPAVERDRFVLSLRLGQALVGIAWILDAPAMVEARLPDVASIRDRFAPRLREDFLARVQLQLLVVFLNEWRREDIGGLLRDFAAGRNVERRV